MPKKVGSKANKRGRVDQPSCSPLSSDTDLPPPPKRSSSRSKPKKVDKTPVITRGVSKPKRAVSAVKTNKKASTIKGVKVEIPLTSEMSNEEEPSRSEEEEGSEMNESPDSPVQTRTTRLQSGKKHAMNMRDLGGPRHEELVAWIQKTQPSLLKRYLTEKPNINEHVDHIGEDDQEEENDRKDEEEDEEAEGREDVGCAESEGSDDIAESLDEDTVPNDGSKTAKIVKQYLDEEEGEIGNRDDVIVNGQEEEERLQLAITAQNLSVALAAPFEQAHRAIKENLDTSIKHISTDLAVALDSFSGEITKDKYEIWAKAEVDFRARVLEIYQQYHRAGLAGQDKVRNVRSRLNDARTEKIKLVNNAREAMTALIAEQKEEVSAVKQELVDARNNQLKKMREMIDPKSLHKLLELVVQTVIKQGGL